MGKTNNQHIIYYTAMKFISLLMLLVGVLVGVLSYQPYPAIENQVHAWINNVRRNPRILIPHLQRQILRFHGKKMTLAPGFLHATKQGKRAWIEAIHFLMRQKPMQGLNRHFGLDLISRDHCSYLKRVNRVGHIGEHGSRLRDRFQKYLIYDHGKIGENIAQEFVKVRRNWGLETVLSLIIDDGVYNRGHRKSLFTK